MQKLSICIPVYDDWPSARVLLERLDDVAASLDDRLHVMFVDDGSSDAPPTFASPRHLDGVTILKLRRNLGHQRAIAIGVTHLFVERTDDAIVVMDGDGEDDPETLRTLLDCHRRCANCVVFASRARRREGLWFRVGYQLYKLTHRVLVGRWMKIGNFSVIPRSALRSLVAVSEIWNHYAAAVVHSRLPLATVALPRAPRIAGRSKMNLVSLVVHGLSAISVHSSVVAVRLLLIFLSLMASSLLAIVAVVFVRAASSIAIPGWATSTVGALLIMFLNLALLSTLMILFALRARAEAAFVPLRDFSMYIAGHNIVFRSEDG